VMSVNRRMYLLLNHPAHARQEKQAREQLGVGELLRLPSPSAGSGPLFRQRKDSQARS